MMSCCYSFFDELYSLNLFEKLLPYYYLSRTKVMVVSQKNAPSLGASFFNFNKIITMKLIAFLVVFCAFVPITNALDRPGNSSSPLVVTAYTYHLKPPFITDLDMSQGLYFDLANQLSDDKIQYKVLYVPRNRFNRLLSEGNFDGILVGVSPHWFKDSEENKFFWTQSFMTDRDDIVSLKESPIEYMVDELLGLTMAGVRGFFYQNLQTLISDESIVRFDTDSEASVVELVIRKRADFGVISQTTFKYMQRNNALLQNIHISNIPHEQYERRIMISKGNEELYGHLMQKIEEVTSSALWNSTLAQYGIQD